MARSPETTDDLDALAEWDIRSVPTCLLLARLGRETLRQFAEALEPSGLTTAHLTALHLLRSGPLSQQTLSDAIAVDPTKLVGLLNDLEQAGLVVRRRHPADRRRHVVEISDTGRTRLAEIEASAVHVQDDLFAGLDPVELDELGRLLRHVAGNTPLGGRQPLARAAGAPS